jgi:crotonobetainyl-CoA hydratase
MTVEFSVADRVARVTLNRPERLNAVDAATEQRLEEIWTEVENRDDISCIVLTGAGQKAFCTGADMKGGSGSSGLDYWAEGRSNGFGGLAFRSSLTVPVVARVNGYALGGGFVLVLGCDLVIAA